MEDSNMKTEQKIQEKTRQPEKPVVATAQPTISKLSASWQAFKPEVPLQYILAAREAAKAKNS